MLLSLAPTILSLLILFLVFPLDIHSADYYPDSLYYHSVDSFGRDIRALAETYPGLMTLEDKARSRNNETLFLLRMTNRRVSDKGKLKILITSGEHAREYLPVESFFKLARNLASAFMRGDEAARFVLGGAELLLVGMLNPDGRRLIESTKNYCHRGMANGVDVNRNMDWGFGGPGSSGDTKNEEYRGVAPFSEPESLFIKDIVRAHNVGAYFSLHTGARFIFVPYGDSESKRLRRRPDNVWQQLHLASVMWAAAGGFFTGLGVVAEENEYTADGTIADYLAGVVNVPYSLTFELYGEIGDLSNCFVQFNPDGVDLQDTLERFHPMYMAAFEYLVKLSHELPFPYTAYKAWGFERHLDSRGGDMFKADLTKDMSERVKLLEVLCDQLPRCVGFTTSGWLKHTILPREQWVKLDAHRDPHAGIYVRLFSV